MYYVLQGFKFFPLESALSSFTFVNIEKKDLSIADKFGT